MTRLILPPGVPQGDARRYCSKQNSQYISPRCFRYGNVNVLPDLIGKRWDGTALKLCHSARPSMIRVTSGLQTTDSILWRITIQTDENGVIKSVTQEAEIAG